jgi:hypothetical protein
MPGIPFQEAQQIVRFHYQYLVLHDFLPRIVHPSVLSELKTDGKYDKKKLELFKPKNEPFMPVEFSVAAYRFGHSMVRPGYRLNDEVLLPIFPLGPKFPQGLTGFRAMDPKRGIDWGRFIDVELRDYDGSPASRKRRLQFAYRIDTSIANPLSKLPPSVASNPRSLAVRNLVRGWRLALPSGQSVANAMGIKPLEDDQILVGKAVSSRSAPLRPITSVSREFKGKCPLWTYILAEAMHHRHPVKIPVKQNITISTPQLGPVGGRIVAEVFLGLMFGDKHSVLTLNPNWKPDTHHPYTLKDFVRYALGQ